MFLFTIACAFGIENTGEIEEDISPVITGGWHRIDLAELDEEVINFAMEYIDGDIDRVWSQIVHGRKYLFAFTDETMTMLGLITLYRDPEGIISLEKESVYPVLLVDFIELFLLRSAL